MNLRLATRSDYASGLVFYEAVRAVGWTVRGVDWKHPKNEARMG